ncbi:MAG: GNAT family N-acetyltransferase [Candidatus Zixiibacteriota bacterium]|nr:MAG: GNAT family N-acetyltransferase [candidate division Zixibacteria bacterium]
MTKITYRHLKRDELLESTRLFQRSFNHLRRKNNRPTHDEKITEVSPFFHHIYDTDNKGFYAAFEGDKMIGFGFPLMRGKQWYLADLFIAPGSQARGVGRELLKRCMRYGKGKADSYSLCTFSYNEVSLALYSSFGIMPLYPIFVMYRKIDKNFRVRPTGLKVVEDKSNKSILRINRLEKKIRGYSRIIDLRFYARSPHIKILNFYANSRWVGYSAVIRNSHIMPAGSPYPKYLPDILSESVRECIRSKGKEIEINIGANNRALFERLKSHGFKIFEMDVFLSTKPYSDLSRYAPASLAMY